MERNQLEIDVFSGPKSPGLIILEHELTMTTVDGFISSFPLIAANGWTFASLARVINTDGYSYQNAQDSTSNDVKVAGILVQASSSAITTSTTPATPSASGHNLSPSPTTSKSASVGLLDLQKHSMISLLFPAAIGVIALFS